MGNPPLLRVRVWVRVQDRVRVQVTVRVGLALGLQFKVSPNRAHSFLLACPGGQRLEEGPGALSEAANLCSTVIVWVIRQADYRLVS